MTVYGPAAVEDWFGQCRLLVPAVHRNPGSEAWSFSGRLDARACPQKLCPEGVPIVAQRTGLDRRPGASPRRDFLVASVIFLVLAEPGTSLPVKQRVCSTD